MANKMADKKKNTGQASRSQARGRTASLKTRTRSDQRKNANSSQPKQASQANPNKTVDLKAENGKEQVPELVAEQSKSKGTKAENRTREQEQEQDKERDKDKDKRKEPASKSAKSVAAPVRRDPKELSRLARLRNTRFIRFILEAYFELRHKVTWPTFPEARNMTIVVVLLSGAVGLVLGAIDFGLLTLFQLINH